VSQSIEIVIVSATYMAGTPANSRQTEWWRHPACFEKKGARAIT